MPVYSTCDYSADDSHPEGHPEGYQLPEGLARRTAALTGFYAVGHREVHELCRILTRYHGRVDLVEAEDRKKR